MIVKGGGAVGRKNKEGRRQSKGEVKTGKWWKYKGKT